MQLVSDTLCVALGHLLEAFSDSQLVATSAGPGCTAISSIRLWGQASNCPRDVKQTISDIVNNIIINMYGAR